MSLGLSPCVEEILARTDHRPWPLPRQGWSIFMRWRDLAFLHWPVPAAVLRERLPERLELDTFEGTAWLGVVPFQMRGVRHRWAPRVPGASAFPELNVRTYVTAGGKPGVWFFSLDAASRIAVRVARYRFHLPYFDAEMRVAERDGAIEYRSRRTHRGAEPGRFEAVYAPSGEPFTARAGTLEHWLTERYCLYAAAESHLWRGEIQHAPWPLQAGAARISESTVAGGLLHVATAEPPLVHFARRLDVLAWTPRSVPASAGG
jgi:hypothetical protein